MIDLRSDTVTQPCAAMREAMFQAQVGDDVYGEDPTVNELESTGADLLGKQAGLFVPSGTQSNLLALLTHCGRGDEYIVGQTAHTYRFEGGGAAALGGIQPQPLDFRADGTLDLQEVEQHIKPDDFHFAKTRVLCLENTHNGQPLPADYPEQARQLCTSHALQLHLDGARFFNAVVALDSSPAALAEPFDTVSICLSKGLGAPVGSLLVGPTDFIAQARRWRKLVGGGMRQAGVIAAGGLYALQNNIERLHDDALRAGKVAQALRARFGNSSVVHATNMLHLALSRQTYETLKLQLTRADITIDRPRWVFHLDIDDAAVEQICDVVARFRE